MGFLLMCQQANQPMAGVSRTVLESPGNTAWGERLGLSWDFACPPSIVQPPKRPQRVTEHQSCGFYPVDFTNTHRTAICSVPDGFKRDPFWIRINTVSFVLLSEGLLGKSEVSESSHRSARTC